MDLADLDPDGRVGRDRGTVEGCSEYGMDTPDTRIREGPCGYPLAMPPGPRVEQPAQDLRVVLRPADLAHRGVQCLNVGLGQVTQLDVAEAGCEVQCDRLLITGEGGRLQLARLPLQPAGQVVAGPGGRIAGPLAGL